MTPRLQGEGYPLYPAVKRDTYLDTLTGLVYEYNGSAWVILNTDTNQDTQSTITSNYTLTVDDNLIICNGTFTVTLPTAVSNTNKKYIITNISKGIITLDANGTETIQGDLTQFIYTDETLDVVSNGSNWFVI